jgi:hypothetical protein
MPLLYLAISSTHHHVKPALHTPTVVPGTSHVDLVHQTRRNRDAQTCPEHARACQSAHGVRPRRAWPRRRATCSVAPSLLSLRQKDDRDPSNAMDTPNWPREPCAPRHGRRHPPRLLGCEDDDERHRPSFSPQSRATSPPGHRLHARVIASLSPPL